MNLRKRLIVFGGGPLPSTGLAKFVEWALDCSQPRILLIGWASEEVDQTIDALAASLLQFGPCAIDSSKAPPMTEKSRRAFLAQLSQASGIFFSGGDQNRTAAVYADPEIRQALHEAYERGIPFAGTSAGTAIMSNIMFAGYCDPGAIDSDGLSLAQGLGLCRGVIFDQHFLKRQRQNRMFAAILKHPEIVGLGVDENTGLAIEDGRFGTVLGDKVMRVEAVSGRRSLCVDLYHEGESFELFSESAVAPPEQAAS